LLGDIIATVRGTISSQQRDGHEYMHVDALNIDLNIKTVRMLVKKVFNNNRILSEYTTEPTDALAPLGPVSQLLLNTAEVALKAHVLAHFQLQKLIQI
jgi:hypothetical protein